MLWMETYLFYCSVRLGALVASILAFAFCSICCMFLFVLGLDVLNPILKLFNDDDHFRHHFIVKKFTKMVDDDSDKLLILFQAYFFSYMASSVAAFYGALKIKKYYLIPLAFFELFRVIYFLGTHILLMTVCKNKLNLGILITATLGGGFLILYLGYNWATIVALYQIITLINSERYKAVYGDDPFHPLIPKTYNPTIQENVRVLVTPNMNEIDEQKQRNALNDFMSKKNAAVQPVISVIPVNFAENGSQHKVKKRNWMQPKWATRSRNPLIVPPVHNDTSTIDNSYSEAYNHWQWSELAPAVSARKTKNIYKYLE